MTHCVPCRLFKTDFGLRGPLLVCYTFKADSEPSGVRHYLQLHTTGHPSQVLLDPNTSPECEHVNEWGYMLCYKSDNVRFKTYHI